MIVSSVVTFALSCGYALTLAVAQFRIGFKEGLFEKGQPLGLNAVGGWKTMRGGL